MKKRFFIKLFITIIGFSFCFHYSFSQTNCDTVYRRCFIASILYQSEGAEPRLMDVIVDSLEQLQGTLTADVNTFLCDVLLKSIYLTPFFMDWPLKSVACNDTTNSGFLIERSKFVELSKCEVVNPLRMQDGEIVEIIINKVEAEFWVAHGIMNELDRWSNANIFVKDCYQNGYYIVKRFFSISKLSRDEKQKIRKLF